MRRLRTALWCIPLVGRSPDCGVADAFVLDKYRISCPVLCVIVGILAVLVLGRAILEAASVFAVVVSFILAILVLKAVVRQ